ncbi:mRNA-decapping enzyme-like protein isoform X2 [Zingiber officinale]|uniref:mRNA-decapping enzyme-like protein isoform X2 n=1 Tax=Zingiber officinale TaxID=94328 RepID=UPI001C4CE899|nr:mRNA-decapping enzyme-like protein isoform X2 [Zingiber officinale]
MTQNGKLMPNLDQNSTKVHNLTVLQRIDSFVEEILMTAAHVTVYEFNIELNQWNRKDVEGSLFVVKRNAQPRFQFIVMNRRNTDNLVENLLGDFEYEVQVPYLLYRNAAQEVNGIWFYNSPDCEAVANLFARILNAYSKVPSKPKVTSKSDFEELEAIPTSVMEGSHEPTSVAMSTPDVPEDAFVNFFSNAVNIGIATNAAIHGQPTLASAPVPVTTQASSFNPSILPTVQSISIPSTSSTPLMSTLDNLESGNGSSSHATNLVKPSYFSPPAALLMPLVPSSVPVAVPSLHPPVTMQQPYGTPLLQPFPPPSPSASLAPPQNFEPVISRDKVRDALLRIVQNDDFVDLVYQEILNAHYS